MTTARGEPDWSWLHEGLPEPVEMEFGMIGRVYIRVQGGEWKDLGEVDVAAVRVDQGPLAPTSITSEEYTAMVALRDEARHRDYLTRQEIARLRFVQWRRRGA